MGTTPSAIDPRRDEAAWLLDRRNRLTATDAAAIVGKHPYRSPLDVYLDKKGLAPPVEMNEAMAWGLILEDPILDAYAERTGREVAARQQYLAHPAREWMAATLDARTACGRLVEVKTIGVRSPMLAELGEAGTDEVPAAWLLQVQHQMDVAGAEVADVAALVGGQELRVFEVRRNDALIARLVDREAKFWADHVLADVPPEPDRGDDCRNFEWLYPDREGGVLWSDGDTLALLDQYQQLGEEIKYRDRQRQMVKASLLALMGGHERATTTDGRTVLAARRHRAGYEVKPTEYLDFRVRNTPGSLRK